MFKINYRSAKINVDQYDEVKASLRRTKLDESFLCFTVDPDYSTEDTTYNFDYTEVESTGLQIPIYYSRLFWLDAESGYVYSSRISLPFYNPLFDLKGFIENYGHNWEGFLDYALKGFSPLRGIDIRDFSIYFSSIEGFNKDFNPKKSLSFNYFNLELANEKEVEHYDALRTKNKFNQFFDVFKEGYIDMLDPLFLIHDNQILNSMKDRNFDLALLENSFQSPIMKDFMGALAGETTVESVAEKARKIGIFDTLNNLPLRLNSDLLQSFFSDKTNTDSNSKDSIFPYEVVINQIGKLIRRLKLKGIV